jgi:Base plate wedge protein 53
MSYFRELPNLEYQSPFATRVSSQQYVLVKNLFRRVKLREDLQSVFTLFDKYQIQDGDRPDKVAEKLYGKADLDWVVLLSAGIVRVRDQWPLSSYQLYQYAENKYGNDLNSIHHYETTQVLDSQGRLVLPAGKTVSSNFTIPNPLNIAQKIFPIVGVTNYEYETKKNEEKRGIYILKNIYLQQYLNDMRSIMTYNNKKSSQFVDRKLIRTENTRNTMP